MRVPLTVGDFLERAALVYGDRQAVVDEPGVPGSLGQLSYAELHDRARAMAAGFDAMGLGIGDRVAIVSPNSARFLTSYFGVSGFGRVLVPINFRLTAEEIAYIVEHSGATALLYDPDMAEATANVAVPAEIALPADGVYAGRYARPDGTHFDAAISIGPPPTFPSPEGATARPLVEAYLLDFAGDLYGEAARVSFVARLRPQQRFDEVDTLVAQMHRDVAEARRLLGEAPASRRGDPAS